VDLTRDEKLRVLECAVTLVHAGLLEPSALEGFKLAQSARVDPINAISGIYDGIAKLYISKLSIERAPTTALGDPLKGR